MLIKHITGNYKKTQKLGEIFAEQIIKNGLQKTAIIIGLHGNLGSGKTTFIQGFAKGLAIKDKILSPTFVILKRFEITKITFKNFYHIDCYRLKNEKDILELGLKEIILNPENIVAIEWPEKIKKVLPKKAITIKFKLIEKNKREIIIKN
jgi:tRNA threonylcarbamoyladenosine biosynthesis protein TsaE